MRADSARETPLRRKTPWQREIITKQDRLITINNADKRDGWIAG